MSKSLTTESLGVSPRPPAGPGLWLLCGACGCALLAGCALGIVTRARQSAEESSMAWVGEARHELHEARAPLAALARDSVPILPLLAPAAAPVLLAVVIPAAPVSDDLPQVRAPPREGTEAAHYAHFVALAAHQDGSLTAAAETTLLASTPESERVALLRALWDSGAAEAAPWFSRALLTPGERAQADAAVPEFALRFLSQRVASEAAARTILADFVAAAPPDCDTGRLSRAAQALAMDQP